MEYRIKNKKLYLATKLLKLWDKRPSFVFFIDPTDPSKFEDLADVRIGPLLSAFLMGRKGLNVYTQIKQEELMSIKPELLSHVLPDLTKPEELMSIKTKSLLSLFPYLSEKEFNNTRYLLQEKFGILDSREFKLANRATSGVTGFLSIKIQRPVLKLFIDTTNGGLLGFNLSDNELYTEIIEILKILMNSYRSSEIKITKFHQKNANKILFNLYKFSDTISITKGLSRPPGYDTLTAEEYKHIHSGDLTNIDSIDVQNKSELGNLLNRMEETKNRIYTTGVNLFLKKYKTLEWKCKECPRHTIGKCESALEITNWLDVFARGGYNTCHKCRKRNIFSISQKGEITYYIVPK